MRHLLLPLLPSILILSGCAVAGTTAVSPTPNPTGSQPPTVTGAPSSPTAVTNAPIVVTSPAEGATVQSPIRIAGNASVFEATVSIRIKNSAGQTVVQTFTTATQGAPERGDFNASVPVDFVGSAVIEVFSQSAKDGSDQFLVRRNVFVGR